MMKGAVVSVLSWNILAPIFVRCPSAPYSWFEYAKEEHVDWEMRRNKIVSMLLNLNADVVTLQEVQYTMEGPGQPPSAPDWFGEGN